MLGRVIISEPRIERWGDGRDGTDTWSNNTYLGDGDWYATNSSGQYINHASKRIHKNGVYQFEKLTISTGTHVEVLEAGTAVPQRLVIFARKEIIIGNNVLINAGRNNWERRSNDYRAFSGNFSGTVSYGSGGGGGGGGGANDGGYGEYGQSAEPYDIVLYHNKNGGVNRGNSYYNPAGSTGGGEAWAGYNSRGANGKSGWPQNSFDKNGIKNKVAEIFGFSNKKGKHGSESDDFPMWQGGKGGRGGRAMYYGGRGRVADWIVNDYGYGGRGGGTIILVAPKITVGSGLKISIQGNTHGNARFAGNKQNQKLKNMNGTHTGGDYGSAGGGGGGGGFFGIVSAPAGLSGWSDSVVVGDGATYGGLGKTDEGNIGGTGGRGGSGIIMRGEKPILAGNIIWKPTNEWAGGTGVEGH